MQPRVHPLEQKSSRCGSLVPRINKGVPMDIMLYAIVLIAGASVMLVAAVMRSIAIFGVSRETEDSVSAHLRVTRTEVDALSVIQVRHFRAQMRSLVGYLVVFMAWTIFLLYFVEGMEILNQLSITFAWAGLLWCWRQPSWSPTTPGRSTWRRCARTARPSSGVRVTSRSWFRPLPTDTFSSFEKTHPVGVGLSAF